MIRLISIFNHCDALQADSTPQDDLIKGGDVWAKIYHQILPESHYLEMIEMYKKIMVGVDGSEHGAKALR